MLQGRDSLQGPALWPVTDSSDFEKTQGGSLSLSPGFQLERFQLERFQVQVTCPSVGGLTQGSRT